MKTPTLEEVKEHFKNAKEVKCVWDNKIYNISNWQIKKDGSGYFAEKHPNAKIPFYCGLFGIGEYYKYAEIVSYKDTKPNHYPQGYDVIDFVKDNELNFNEGNVIKYVVRARKKGGHIEDLKKAKDYLEREIKHYENNRPTNPNS